jgi:hypothetical protein
MRFNAHSQTDFPAHTVAYTGTAGNTATWNPGPEYVLVWSDTAAYIEVGAGAVATASSTPLPANTPTMFRVPPGTSAPWRVSAIQVATGGNLYAKPVQGV